MFCSNCGNAVREGTRFCGTCGAPADAAPAEASANAPSVPPEPVGSDPGSMWGASGSAAAPLAWSPTAGPEAGAPSPKKKAFKTRAVIVVAGIVVLALVGSWVAHAAGGSSAGAGSAQSAADHVIDAVRAEDPEALANMIAPDELADLADIVKSASGKGSALDLTTSKTHPFAGLDLDITNPQVHVSSLADGYARIDLTGGTLSYKIDKSKLSPKIRDAMSPDARLSDSSDLGQFACSRTNADGNSTPVYCKNGGLGPFVIAIRESGRWYISPTYTGLEYWRLEQDLPAADFGSHKQAPHTGSDTPQAAVEAMADAIGSANVDAALSLLPPDEFQGVYDYTNAIHEALQRGNAPTFLFSVTPGSSGSSNVSVQDVKGGKKVVIHSASGEYAGEGFDGESVRLPWSLQDSCMTTTNSDGETNRSCASDAVSRLSGTAGSSLNGTPGSSLSELYVITVNRGGKWYVSPADTIAAYGRAFIDSLQPSDINLNNNSDGNHG